jgi:hypothetical protein
MMMRLNVLILSVLFLGVLARPGIAQVGGGVIGGVNLASVSLDPEDLECCDFKSGGVFGAYLRAGTGMVSFQPELLYSMKGAKGSSDDSKIKVNVIEIPLLLHANLIPGPVRPFVEVGPAVSFKTSAKFEEPDGTETDISDEVNSTDFGVIVGGGLAFGPASVGLRYDHGLKNLSDDPADPDASAKTRTLSILFTVGFGR